MTHGGPQSSAPGLVRLCALLGIHSCYCVDSTYATGYDQWATSHSMEAGQVSRWTLLVRQHELPVISTGWSRPLCSSPWHDRACCGCPMVFKVGVGTVKWCEESQMKGGPTLVSITLQRGIWLHTGNHSVIEGTSNWGLDPSALLVVQFSIQGNIRVGCDLTVHLYNWQEARQVEAFFWLSISQMVLWLCRAEWVYKVGSYLELILHARPFPTPIDYCEWGVLVFV
jgi:hypothetical protein